jgi:2'-5' RNA ligase
MAAIVLQVPKSTASVLSEVDISKWGEPESKDSYHITLMYLGDDLPVEKVGEILPVIYSITSKFEPFTVRTNRVSTFPPHPEHGTVPLICPIECNRLHDLHGDLCQACDNAGIEYSKKFKEFQPHVTLGYANSATSFGKVDIKFSTLEWGAHEATLWGADFGDGRLVVTFPLTLKVSKMARKVAQRCFNSKKGY